MTEFAPLSPRGKGADDPHPSFRKRCHKLPHCWTAALPGVYVAIDAFGQNQPFTDRQGPQTLDFPELGRYASWPRKGCNGFQG